MLSGLRSIFLQTTLRWLPFQGYAVGKDTVRGLYHKMFEPGGYRYENLDLQSDPPTLSTRHQAGHSVCRFGPDFLTIEEKRTGVTIEGFVEAVETVLRGLRQEDVPPFYIQQCKMQCLAQPANVENSLELLAQRVSNVYKPVEPFERPPSFFGVKFEFHPVTLPLKTAEPDIGGKTEGKSERSESENATERIPETSGTTRVAGFVTARFETYAEDVSQVWMEVTASYPETEQPLLLRDLQRIGNNIKETHHFLTSKCKRFLDQFDAEATHDSDSGPEGS